MERINMFGIENINETTGETANENIDDIAKTQRRTAGPKKREISQETYNEIVRLSKIPRVSKTAISALVGETIHIVRRTLKEEAHKQSYKQSHKQSVESAGSTDSDGSNNSGNSESD